jgi:hypothetical protein
MSDVNLNFVVENNNIGFTVEPNDITITPEEIQLTFNANFQPLAGGGNTQLQYNLNGTLDGIPNVTFNGSNISLGNVANVKITGGTNGYVLQTDGTGNLDWTAQTGGGGNGTPGGSNTQIQYNDNGTFGGNAGFTFNEVTGNIAIPGNLIVAGNITGSFDSNYANFAGNVVDAAQPNITSVGTLTSLNSSGTITAPSFTANTGVFSGNGSGLSAIVGANVTGTVANATHASTANTVIDAAQPNITSVGTLSNLSVTNNTTTANLNVSSIANIVTGIENISIIGAQTGTYDFDVLTSPIRYSTGNATANLTLNVRGNSSTTFNSLIANGQSMTVSYALTNGATAYGVTSLSIDGSSITPKYAGSNFTAANSIVTYTYTIIKNSGVFTALGSVTRYQ